jgi:hypothetical protein
MPVILTTPDEVETWLTAPLDEALKLQRLLSERIAPGRRPRRQGRSSRVGGMTEVDADEHNAVFGWKSA